MAQNDLQYRLIKPPKGTRDMCSQDIAIRDDIISKIKHKFELYGGVPTDTPVIECMDVVKSLYGEEFNKLVYSLDADGEKLILRYDLTVPFARYVVNNGLINFKRYQIGKVYRRDDPQISKGRYREFLQADFDIIGTDYQTYVQDTEMLSLLNSILSNILGESTFKIKINNKKLLFDILVAINADRNDFNTICSSIDKLDKCDWDTIKSELINIKEIESKVIDGLTEYVNIVKCEMSRIELLDILLNKKFITNETYEEMKTIFTNIDLLGLNNVIIFDPLLSRGLDYYTGIIYEAIYMNQEIMPSSIAAGGRYDNMLSELGNRGIIPAIGLSIGIERIATILEINNKKIITIPQIFIATVGNNMAIQKLLLANELRQKDICIDYFYNKNPKMRQQLDYVFKTKIPYMIVIGDNEIKTGVVKFKNINENKEITINRENIVTHLQDQHIS